MGYTIGTLTRLPLGWQGESNSRPIDIDVSDWLITWPGAAINMLVQRPGEEEYYPANSKILSGHLMWTPTRSDVEIAGSGKLQIILTDDSDVELRSRVVETLIGHSLSGTVGEAPEPAEGWVADVMQAVHFAQEAVDKMPYVGENGNWMMWDAVSGAFQDSGVPATGPKGDDGSMITNVYVREKPLFNGQGGMRRYVIDVDGKPAYTFEVYDGQKGVQGDVGPEGPQGIQGPQGPRGEAGPVGPEGPQGAQGPRGLIGPQGVKGDTGATGATGKTGPQGPKGDRGLQGVQGEPGPAGPAGDGVFVVRISSPESNVVVSSHTPAEIKAAYDAGKIVYATMEDMEHFWNHDNGVAPVMTLTSVSSTEAVFQGIKRYMGNIAASRGLWVGIIRVAQDKSATVGGYNPTETPNPFALKLTGAVEATYDGSSAVTVEIPQGGGGSTSKEVTILSATTLTVEDADAGTYVLLSPFENKPAGGMLCTVTYNGVEYKCPAGTFDKGQGAVVAMGNFSLIGEEGGNADAPFVLMCAPDGTEGMYAMMMVTDAPSSVTVSITAKVVDEAITAYVDNKVDELRKEIPETPEQTTDVLTVTADMSNLEVSNVSHTYAEIVEAIKAGKMVQMIVNQGEGIASYAVPLVMWQESEQAKYLKFQRTLHMGTGIDYENTIVTITYNGGAGGVTAEAMAMPYMTRAQVVDLINEMMGQ